MELTRKIGVIVVNYGVAHELPDSLAALSDLQNLIVVIVDNYFSDTERDRCRSLSAEMGWSLVEMTSNAGFGAGCNAGVERAASLGCEDILLLNPDATIELADIARIQQRSATDDTSMLAPTVMAPDPRNPGSDRVWFRGGLISWAKGLAYHSVGPAPDSGFDWLTGACIYFRLEAWAKLDGFDESYFLYWEDVDFTYRWKRIGGRLVVLDDAIAYHRVGGTQSTGTPGKSTTFIYYNMLNRARFASKHLSTSGRIRWILATPFPAFRILRRNRPAFTGDHAIEYWGAFIRGTFAGLRMMLGRGSPPANAVGVRSQVDG